MKKTNTERHSHCSVCGKRMSSITASGDIRWLPSRVDDVGLFCDVCYETKGPGKSKKSSARRKD